MISLTARQQDALRFITGFQAAKGYSPSITEIAVGIGQSANSKARTHELLHSMQDRGALRLLPRRARAIEVLAPIAIPRAPDGEPLHFVRVGGQD
ncbi:LexA family protein [Erythrobacter sp. NE805]|uniref:LexA family protein n=1 Tax=Erythrobacter sp. NE805 TaxID=3389875 RepID=UPI00396B315D